MGKVLSLINKQIKRFNVENRTQRILAKDKPIAAPKHPSTLKVIDQLITETKGYKDDLMMKHKKLDENLKKVYVTSMDITVIQRKPSEEARLPKIRSMVDDNELGYEEPEHVQEGFVTLKQALKILADHQQDTKKYNVPYFTSQYKLTEEDTVHLLKYFSAFKVHIPEKLVTGKPVPVRVILKSAIQEESRKEIAK